MGTPKSMFGVIGALVAVLYWGGLLYYFFDVAGSVENARQLGLGPTLLAIAAFGLLFLIVLVVRIARMAGRPPSPGKDGHDGSDASKHDDEGGFDADAAIARYMASRSRFCGHSSHPDQEAGYGDEGSIGRDGFVVACGDTAKVLNLVDEELDEMTLLIVMPIVRNGARTASVGRDDGSHVAIRERSAKVIGIESLVANKVFAGQAINQGLGLGRLVHLSSREEQTQDIAEGVDGNVNLRAQSSARSPDRLFLNLEASVRSRGTTVEVRASAKATSLKPD